MVDSLNELKPGDIVFAGTLHFKIHRVTKVKEQTGHDKGGGCYFEECEAKTVPPTFTHGELHKDLYKDLTLRRFVSGDAETWETWMREQGKWSRIVDMTYAAVCQGEPLKKLANDLKGISKLGLIAYLIKVHGPSLKDDLLRMTAAIEGQPWIPTSNQEYFSNTQSVEKRGFLGKKRTPTLVLSGKLGRKTLYGISDEGEERAKKVLARLGEGPAREAK
jgi:hypothetical protein